MANKEVYMVGPLTEGRKNIIAGLPQEYDIQSAEPNYRNGTKTKKVRSKYGELEIMFPDRFK